MNISQSRPTEASDDGDFARQLLAILGTAYNAPDGSVNASDALALGGALADARAVVTDALSEAFPDAAVDLLDELETQYGLPVRRDLTTTARQTRLLAKVRAARAGSPQDVVLSVGLYDPSAHVLENTPSSVDRTSDGYSPGGDRTVFEWAVVIKLDFWNDPTIKASILALLDQMKPAHTLVNLVVNTLFLTDDFSGNSRTDRDMLGS